MSIRLSLAAIIVLTSSLAGAQESQPTQPTETCAGAGGECMEGCEAPFYQDIGAMDCFDSTCCLRLGGTGVRGAGPVDQSDPALVVGEIFDAARSGDFSRLGGLCDPQGEADGDVRSICGLASDPGGAGEFVEYFSAGGVAGEPTVEGDTAAVPITFGPGGTETETITLVKRGEQWYLQSF